MELPEMWISNYCVRRLCTFHPVTDYTGGTIPPSPCTIRIPTRDVTGNITEITKQIVANEVGGASRPERA